MRRRLGIAAAGLAALLSRPARAQGYPGASAADSAAVARAAAGRAAAARRAGDLVAARDEAAHAYAAWPLQPAYALAWAAAAARVSDTAGVLRALSALASLGMGRDLSADSVFAPYRGVRGFDELRRLLARNAARVVRGRVRATLRDSTFWPEALDYDPRTRRFYVSSVRHGVVAEAGPAGEWRELWARGGALRGAVMAVRVDTARDVVWATLSGVPQMEGYRAADSTIGALVRVRIADGVVEGRWDLPIVRGGHALGDLVVTARGDVYVTDSNEPVLYRLRAGVDTLEQLRHPLFRSLQGMAEGAEGRALYVADYSVGLLRLDVASGDVTRLTDAPHSTSVGCDGIAYADGAIVAVQNGVAPPRIVRFVLDAAGARIARVELLDRNVAVADEPTSVVVVNGEAVYVADSQWDKHDARGARIAGTSLRPPILIGVPLRAAGATMSAH